MSTRGEQPPASEQGETEPADIICGYIINGGPMPDGQAPEGSAGMLAQIKDMLSGADTPGPIVEKARGQWQASPDLPTGNDVKSASTKSGQFRRWHEITQILSDLRLERDQFAFDPALDTSEY